LPTIQSLQKQINSLKEENAAIKKRLSVIGEKISAPEEVPEQTQVVSDESPPKVKAHVKQPKKSFEEDVGKKWFARIGILALVIGLGFFIKYAIDMHWINHLTRIILAVTFGIALVVFGEIISRKEKYAVWAKTLVGGGLAIMYFAIYAAYQFTDYREAIGITQPVDIFLLSLVVIFAILLSLKDDSQVVAAEAFFLGYLVSLLSNNYGLMNLVYGLILTIGLVIVVSYKKWPAIGIGGLVASYLFYLLWRVHNNNFAYSSIILISYFIAFTFQSVFLLKNKEILRQNIALTLTNSLLFFALYYHQINSSYPKFVGLFALIFSILHFIEYGLLREQKNIATTYLYLALLYITLAIPIQLNREWITIVWALEALLLTILSFKTGIRALRISSYAVGIFVALKTLAYDSIFLHGLDFANILKSTRMFSFLVTIACFYLIYWAMKINRKLLSKDENVIPIVYSWFATGFFLLVIFLELSKYSIWVSFTLAVLAILYILISRMKVKEFQYQSIAISAVLFLKILFYDSWKLTKFSAIHILQSSRLFAFVSAILAFYFISFYIEKNNKGKIRESVIFDLYSYGGTFLTFLLIMIEMKEFWISIGWSILALILTASGFIFRKKQLRIQGLILFSITIFKVFIYDIRGLETIYRTISYIVLGVILLLVSFIYTKYKGKLKEIL